MSSRDNILGRIRDALVDHPTVELPPVPEVWPRTDPSADEMTARFTEEIGDVSGEVVRCADMADARGKLAAMLGELAAKQIGAIDSEACRDVVAELSGIDIEWGQENPDAKSLAGLDAGIVPALCLLADTGSCVVDAGNRFARLMCYLPPICFVLASRDVLREHMPAAWKEIGGKAAEADSRGELVVITGPSRTADIEKILILGVHGPKRVIVLLID